MLVKALRLRSLGHRIPTDALRQESPMVGELSYHPHGEKTLGFYGRISEGKIELIGGRGGPQEHYTIEQMAPQFLQDQLLATVLQSLK